MLHPQVSRDGEDTDLIARGRHDPCVVPRAVPMVEAMVALVLADQLLQARPSHLMSASPAARFTGGPGACRPAAAGTPCAFVGMLTSTASLFYARPRGCGGHCCRPVAARSARAGALCRRTARHCQALQYCLKRPSCSAVHVLPHHWQNTLIALFAACKAAQQQHSQPNHSQTPCPYALGQCITRS